MPFTTWILLGAAVALLVWKMIRMRPDIGSAEARQLVASGARLVDVRTPGEFASAHLPGAVNVPVDALERRLGEIGAKEQAVVLYCASGARSAHAKRVLARHGFTAVHNLGPMRAW